MIFIDSNEDGSNNVIVIDESKISATGTITIYTDILLRGDSTITTSKCISSFNDSQIIIDLTTRSKDQAVVLSYNCNNIPDLSVELRGSYADGCVPRYEVKKSSLILMFDTASCQDDTIEDTGLIIGVIGGIVALCIVVVVIVIIMMGNDNICAKWQKTIKE